MGADIAHTRFISKFNKGFQFLLCVIDICGKYDWNIKKVLRLLWFVKKI